MNLEVSNIQEMICHALLMSYGNVDGAISYIVDWVYDAHQKEKVKVKRKKVVDSDLQDFMN
jgi:hypothetical protein